MSFQGVFNRQPFNREFSLEILASILMEGEGGFTTTSGRETSATVNYDSEGSFILSVGKKTVGAMILEGIGEGKFVLGKLRIAEMEWQAIGELIINNESFTIFTMEYFGTLAPNDRVIINTERFTVTKNNVNDLENFDGNFIDLKEGINEIRFEDGESTRKVLIRVEHRDRFV